MANPHPCAAAPKDGISLLLPGKASLRVKILCLHPFAKVFCIWCFHFLAMKWDEVFAWLLKIQQITDYEVLRFNNSSYMVI